MKKVIHKILASVLTLALVFGIIAGTGTLEADASDSENPTTLTVKVVDEEGNPVSGLELYLKSTEYGSYGDLKFDSVTDEQGMARYICNNEEFNDDIYEIHPVESSSYVSSSVKTVTFDMESWSSYIDTVDGEPYTGGEVVLVVSEEEPEPSITNVTAAESVSMDATSVDVTVEGANLTDTLYYKRAYKYIDEYGDTMEKTLDWSGKSIAAVGDEGTRTVSIPIDYAANSDAIEWKISVAASQDGTYTPVSVKIDGAEAKVAKITNVTVSKTSVSAEGETITATISGENLPDTVYGRLYYQWTMAGNFVDSAYSTSTLVTGGSDTEKSFEVTIPAKETAEQDLRTEIKGWKVGAALSANATSTAWTKSELIAIEDEGTIPGDEVTEETKAALDSAIAEAGELNASDYTAESWKDYADAIAAANELKNNAEATETQYQDAIKAIADAKAALVKEEASEPSITKVSAAESVSKDATSIDVTVEGENLPDTMYYKRAYKYVEFGDTLTKTLDWSGKEIAAAGNESKRTLSIPVSQYDDALEWVINVSASQSGPYTPVNVKIEGAEAKNPEITDVKVSKTTVSEAGETITATVTGVNLPDTVYGKLFYTIEMNGVSSDISYGDILSSTEGTDTEKTFEVVIPEREVVGRDISGWKFGAALQQYATYEKSELIAVEEEPSPDEPKEETKTALDSAIAGLSELTESDYTAESWKAYKDAIDAANELKNNPNATETQYQDALKAINDAKAGLKAAEKPAPQPTIKKVKVSKITVSGISKKIAAGKKIQLSAAVAPKNATNKAVTWTTSNKKYATVSSTGKVTVKKAGVGKTVTIKAAAKDGSGVKASYKIKIMKNSVKSIKLKAAKSVKAGKSLKVKATVKTNGKKANKKLKWTSSNTKYAKVTASGKVKTYKAGKGKTVKITAKATDGSNKKKTVKIKIK